MTTPSKSFQSQVLIAIGIFALLQTGLSTIAHSANQIVSKTSMTVMNVTEFVDEPGRSPKETIYYKVTHSLDTVNYIREKEVVKFSWGPLPGYNPWKPGSRPPLSARIWSFRTANSGKSYKASGWDVLSNATTSKKINKDNTYDGVGTMISSLCHTNATCNATERTNILFWP